MHTSSAPTLLLEVVVQNAYRRASHRAGRNETEGSRDLLDKDRDGTISRVPENCGKLEFTKIEQKSNYRGIICAQGWGLPRLRSDGKSRLRKPSSVNLLVKPCAKNSNLFGFRKNTPASPEPALPLAVDGSGL